MSRRVFVIVLLCLLPLLNCSRVKEPLDLNNPGSNAAVVPQTDIPWPSLADSPWPMYHHDPQATGRSHFKGPDLGRIKWIFNVGAPVATAAAIGEDSTIYFGSSYEDYGQGGGQLPFLYALDFKGKLKWKFGTLDLQGTPVFASAPVVSADGTIYIGCRDHRFYAVQPDGQLKWTFVANDEISIAGMSIGLDGVIYFVDGSGYLYAVNPDGSLRWKTNGSFVAWESGGISMSPDGATLYLGVTVTSANDSIAGLAAVGIDGQVKWIFRSGAAAGSPLVDNDGNIFFFADERYWYKKSSGESGIYSVTPDGKLRWKYHSIATPSLDLAMDFDGNIFFEDEKSGTEFWIVSTDHEGKLRWQYDISEDGTLASSIVCDVDGTICAATHYHLFAIGSQGNLRWRMKIEPVGNVSLALDEGLLYIGTWFPLAFGSEQGKKFMCIE